MSEDSEKTPMIRIAKDGPYIVTGEVPLMRQRIVCDADGESIEWREGEAYPVSETYALCRCGRTGTPPFCDGTHGRVGFDGTETASREPYLERADWIEGEGIRLSDAPGFCSHARFCMRGEGIWDLVERSEDPEAQKTALGMAANCHSGRLVIWDRVTGDPIEPVLEPSIGVVEEPDGRPGPLWVRGGIPVISADGTAYEVRNRMTLCRCGRSENRPFCDGAHRGL
jgi:CDGSH-type Zn-finger protein